MTDDFCVIHSCCLHTRRNAGRREGHVTMTPAAADRTIAVIGHGRSESFPDRESRSGASSQGEQTTFPELTLVLVL